MLAERQFVDLKVCLMMEKLRQTIKREPLTSLTISSGECLNIESRLSGTIGLTRLIAPQNNQRGQFNHYP